MSVGAGPSEGQDRCLVEAFAPFADEFVTADRLAMDATMIDAAVAARIAVPITEGMWWVGAVIARTRVGPLRRRPPTAGLVAAIGGTWWGLAGYSAVSWLGCTTQVPWAAFVACDVGVVLHRSYGRQLVLRDRPLRAGCSPAEVTVLEGCAAIDLVDVDLPITAPASRAGASVVTPRDVLASAVERILGDNPTVVLRAAELRRVCADEDTVVAREVAELLQRLGL